MQAPPSSSRLNTPVQAPPRGPPGQQPNHGPGLKHGSPIDTITSMPNLVLKQVADVFAAPHVPLMNGAPAYHAHHLTPAYKVRVGQVITQAHERFHDAVDQIEYELAKAEAIYYRVVLEARARRAEEERKERERREEEKRELERKEKERLQKEEQERQHAQQQVQQQVSFGDDAWGANVFSEGGMDGGGMDLGMNDMGGMSSMGSEGAMDGGFFSIYDN